MLVYKRNNKNNLNNNSVKFTFKRIFCICFRFVIKTVFIALALLLINYIWYLLEKNGYGIPSPLDYSEGMLFFCDILLAIIIAYFQYRLEKKFKDVEKNLFLSDRLKEISDNFSVYGKGSIVPARLFLKDEQVKTTICLSLFPKNSSFIIQPNYELNECYMYYLYNDGNSKSRISVKHTEINNGKIRIFFADDDEEKLKIDLCNFLINILHINSYEFPECEKKKELEFIVEMNLTDTLNRYISLKSIVGLVIIPTSAFFSDGSFSFDVTVKDVQ